MKHLFAMFALLFAVGVSVAADDGIPWNCKNLATAQQLAAASSNITKSSVVERNAIMLAYLTTPADFDTFAKADAKVAELCPNATPQRRFDMLSRMCFCQHDGTLQWGEAMAADARQANSYHYLIWIGSKKSFAGKSFAAAERKANLKAGIMLAVTSRERGLSVAKALRVYTTLSAGDEDAVVVPFLKEIYRLVLPKVTQGDDWKQAAVITGLALKARGVNVE